MSLSLPTAPPSLKSIQHYLKTATEHEKRDPVVVFWCRIAALQAGLALDKSSKEALALLLPLMDWLETTKKEMAANEAISNEVVANAHLENYAMKLFLWADKEDRAANFNKNVVKAFYTSGILFEVLTTFGELTPEVSHHKKYAKWKAAYIHNCLKNGETPIAGPMATGEDDDLQLPGVPGSETTHVPNNPQDGGAAGYPPSGYAPVGGVPVYPPAGAPGYPPAGAPGYPPAGAPGYPPTGAPGYPPAGAPDYAPAGAPQQPVYPQAGQPAAAAVAPVAALRNLNLQPSPGGVKLTVEQIAKAQKFCKYAISSLDYEDMQSAVDNLNKALVLCTTGQEQQ